ncbi:MAG: thioredoxin domain-containing protein [Phycisphaeraceae bacterium]|nr:thioredoxin domain-containing protein [Phycisphaeraceae bacterium]
MSTPTTTERRANRLSKETSPYLLQHAHNPVDWHPWGPEAFALARERGVPIFLSIGYSTCYWCHVMERESFESEAIARLMNEKFVCVKVDREERPDVDDIYMASTMIMTGRGGWPMSCFLEPARLRPFWCGTYFPPEARQGMHGFPQVLDAMSRAWAEQREQVNEQAEAVARAVREQLATRQTPTPVGHAEVEQAVGALLTSLDRTNGGFGGAPKFPQPVFLDLLASARARAGDEETRAALDHALRFTLDRMAIGGMRDQVAGGFHRYSVDAFWTIPHFEKMLYDNAQLAATYARAAEQYDDSYYRRVARETLDYVLREMTLEHEGQPAAFFSAQDAEVDGREGLNYLWTPAEVREVLDEADADFIIEIYGLGQGPNFQDPHHPDQPPSSVLRLADRPDRLAEARGLTSEAFNLRLARLNSKLYEARSRRKQPRRDDKVLASWNGLMIAALAEASRVLNDRRYLDAASNAAGFILSNMVLDDATLLRSWRAGKARTTGFLEDYALVIKGLVSLHRARLALGEVKARSKQLDTALRLLDRARALFGDVDAPGFFDTRADQPDLFVRTRTTHDGALPSGSSVMLHNLIDLYEITQEGTYLEQAIDALRALSPAIKASPIGTSCATLGLLRLLAKDVAAFDGMSQERSAKAPPAKQAPAGGESVEVYASEDRLQVGQGKPAELRVRVTVPEGQHILAADPGPGGGGLMPMRLGIVGGSGVFAYADYPAGAPYGQRQELRVYKGAIELRVALERQGPWIGRPRLAVQFQACTERECLPPKVVELGVELVERGAR